MENPHAPRSDPHRDISHFLRSREQDHALGLYTAEEIAAASGTEDASEAAGSNAASAAEVLQAPTASAEDSTSSTTSSTLLLRCQVKNFKIDIRKIGSDILIFFSPFFVSYRVAKNM